MNIQTLYRAAWSAHIIRAHLQGFRPLSLPAFLALSLFLERTA